MEERQSGEDDRVIVEHRDRGDGPCVEHLVRVGVRRQLGRARGSAGVEERGDVAGPWEFALEFGLRLCGGRFGEVDDLVRI